MILARPREEETDLSRGLVEGYPDLEEEELGVLDTEEWLEEAEEGVLLTEGL